MRRYIWFHPQYIEDEKLNQWVIRGQINNALSHGYTVLTSNKLHKVGVCDHLTIVGHSTLQRCDNDSGFYYEGENAAQSLQTLQAFGLKKAPKILSLEICKAGIDKGFAHDLSQQFFFRNTVIEANPGSIGRNPGTIHWGFEKDDFGRVVLHSKNHLWRFFLSGKLVVSKPHNRYDLLETVNALLSKDIHKCILSHYKPGFFGGRLGRLHRATGVAITLDIATFFARENPHSATAKALHRCNREAPP